MTHQYIEIKIKELEERIKALELEQEDYMSRDEVIDILLNEMECVQRASDKECNRDCAKCDLLRDTNKILQAYRISIKALEHPEENVVAIMPCGDAISREAVISAIDEREDVNGNVNAKDIRTDIVLMPPVTPQPKVGKCSKVRKRGTKWTIRKERGS